MPVNCKDCDVEYDGFDGKMVMLHNHLWMQVCDDRSDCICDECIEKRLGRQLTLKDLRPNGITQGMIPVNYTWAVNKGLLT